MKPFRKILRLKHRYPNTTFVVIFLFFFSIGASVIYVTSKPYVEALDGGLVFVRGLTEKTLEKEEPKLPPFNKELYDKKLFALANRPFDFSTSTATSTATTTKKYKWPVKTVYPNAGAILPFKRVVAFYGNFLSTKMGVLGEYPEDVMLAKLDSEVNKWHAADPTTPVQPAFHYIVVTAQASPGADGMYRLRMPDREIDKALAIAKKRNAIVFLDFQVGLSTIQKELPMYDAYLKLPEVHVGMDPEFSMKGGARPGTVIGTYDASDVNFVAEHLAKIVRDNNLPPKILVIHRFTENMVTNYQNIRPLPEVQIVMNMDGWGDKNHKQGTYQAFVYAQPVQFAGFKLFYKNDYFKASSSMMTPPEVLRLTPQPIYIQYQ